MVTIVVADETVVPIASVDDRATESEIEPQTEPARRVDAHPEVRTEIGIIGTGETTPARRPEVVAKVLLTLAPAAEAMMVAHADRNQPMGLGAWKLRLVFPNPTYT